MPVMHRAKMIEENRDLSVAGSVHSVLISAMDIDKPRVKSSQGLSVIIVAHVFFLKTRRLFATKSDSVPVIPFCGLFRVNFYLNFSGFLNRLSGVPRERLNRCVVARLARGTGAA